MSDERWTHNSLRVEPATGDVAKELFIAFEQLEEANIKNLAKLGNLTKLDELTRRWEWEGGADTEGTACAFIYEDRTVFSQLTASVQLSTDRRLTFRWNYADPVIEEIVYEDDSNPLATCKIAFERAADGAKASFRQYNTPDHVRAEALILLNDGHTIQSCVQRINTVIGKHLSASIVANPSQ